MNDVVVGTLLFKILGYLRFFCKEINTFIEQGCIQLIKSDTKVIYNVTKVIFSIGLLHPQNLDFFLFFFY